MGAIRGRGAMEGHIPLENNNIYANILTTNLVCAISRLRVLV